ncbi:DedA family protein [Streptomyces sp. B1I3]|uniref:DedA family protein n=1 Tax=Streptomyces sp. B1I3 TaxID=3042264 RepID=UPI002783EC8F|nr:DedA family protein [Streptomyces sp. B1I3]MDQ0795667.1 membrane-associated protein [Streptomyces sp. B1I3]
MNTLALGPSWLDPDYLLNTFGLPGLLLIVFAESGLLIGFFLPGDSLLFTTGLLVTTGDLKYPLWLVCLLVALAAIIGDQVGYLFGRKVGPSLFRRPDSRLFKQENVEKAHDFFEKYGPKSLVLARFVPIVRTFTPIIAGVSRMNYRSFITFNIIGGVLWGVGVTLLGAGLGKIDFVHEHIELILILIVLVSVVPIGIEFLRARSKSKKSAAEEPREDEGATGQVHGRDEDPYDGGQGAAHNAGPYTAAPEAGPYGNGGATQYGNGPADPYGNAPADPYGTGPYDGGQAAPYGGGQDPYGSAQAAPYGGGRQHGNGYGEPYGGGQNQYGDPGQGQYGNGQGEYGGGQNHYGDPGQGQYGNGQNQYGDPGQGQYGNGQNQYGGGQGQFGNGQASPYGNGQESYGNAQAAPYGNGHDPYGNGGQAGPYGDARPYGNGQAAPDGGDQEGDAGSYGWQDRR